jgi:nicotinamide mononucleotide adenylyltransferase
MSGVAGGNRIQKADVQATFNKYVDEVLKAIPGFKRASLSGSVKTGSKADYGDLDIIVWFEGDDKKEVKQRIIDRVNSLPQNIIVPFKSQKYAGRRFYNAGELISVLFPIVGKDDEFIQVDNIISISEEEQNYKGSFLDLPAEKQGLLIGLAKVILLEENPEEVFRRMGITNIPKLGKGEEFEFNLSSVKLTLRKVKLDNFREVAREDIWSTTNWGQVKILFKNYNIDGSFEDLLDDIARKVTNPRSKNRIAGTFKSMVSVKSGEVGTPKGAGKEAALEKVAQTLSEALDDQSITVALYAGGFKPPHKAHYENAKLLSQNADKLIIFIGPKVREGVKITAEQSRAIWEIYAKYLATPVEIVISQITPIKDIYDWVDQNQDKVDKIITGTMADEKGKFASFEKNKNKYPKVEIKDLPIIVAKEDDKFSATEIRKSKDYLISGKWVPSVISKEDKQEIVDIVTPQEEPSIEDKMADTIDEVFASFFPQTAKKKQIKEGSSGTPIAATSAIPSEDRAELIHLFDELKEVIPLDNFELDFQQDRIVITNKRQHPIAFDYTPYMGSLLEYMIHKGMKVTPLPEIKIKKDLTEAHNFFGKTAYYDPNKKEIILYVMNRHPKDVMRSFSHEMIHHMQNMEGRLGGRINTSNVNEDEYLQEIEKEAYLEGNMCFRGWEDSIKNSETNQEVVAEGRYDKISNQASSDVFRGWKTAYDKGRKKIKFEETYFDKDVEFDVEATLIVKPGIGKMEVLDSTGAGFDEDGDFIIANIAIDPELLPGFWKEISMTLKDIFRHEIEHLTHNRGGISANPAKIMQGDLARREKIKAGELPINNYFKLKKEIDANIQGMLFRAKKEKRPYADVVNNYLDAQDITPEQKQEILNLWRERMPALGIKQPL